jgi:hypothetical protein
MRAYNLFGEKIGLTPHFRQAMVSPESGLYGAFP